jgi:hypothetical protein
MGNAQDDDTVPSEASDSLSDTVTSVEAIQKSEGFYDTIVGPLPDSIEAHQRPYLVVGDIEVPMHKTVTIEPGVVFLFKNFTGFQIQGKLLARGTKERPIIFTSENDRSVNSKTALYPNPYDWNGIYIHSNGVGTILSYCNVLYSVYGIASETKFIRLDPVTLRFNGKSNLVIEGKERKVTDQPYYYSLSTKDAIADGVSANFFRDPFAFKRGVVRYASFTLLIASIIGGIDSGLHYKEARNDLKALSTDNPAILRNNDESNWFDLRDKRDRYAYYTCACGLASVLGLIGFSWSFSF